jgi:hypothetical protein
MNTEYMRKCYVGSVGEKLLPVGLNIERLKRANSMSIRLTDIGFPWESEIEAERVVVHGDVQVSC